MVRHYKERLRGGLKEPSLGSPYAGRLRKVARGLERTRRTRCRLPARRERIAHASRSANLSVRTAEPHFPPAESQFLLSLPHISPYGGLADRMLRDLCTQLGPDAMCREPRLSGRLPVALRHPVDSPLSPDPASAVPVRASFAQPGSNSVENDGIGPCIPKGQELVLERAVEALIHRTVFSAFWHATSSAPGGAHGMLHRIAGWNSLPLSVLDEVF